MAVIMHLAILPGRGIGPLRLGMTRAEARAVIGPPEQESQDECAGEESVAWYYWSIGLSLHFHEAEDFRLDTTEADDEQVTLDGHRVLGIDEAALLTALRDHPSNRTECDRDLDTRKIDFDALGLTFWSEGGNISIGPDRPDFR